MKTIFGRFALFLMMESAVAFGVPVNNGGKVTLSSTAPVALSTNPGGGSQLVNKVRIQVIPGQSCKIYVGTNTLTGSNDAFAVLFPNPTGGWSEKWELQDPRNGDGIDISKIYVKTDCPGEGFYYQYFQIGSPLASVLTPRRYGLLTNNNSAVPITSLVDAMFVVQVRVVPGMVGKINIARTGTGSPFAVLFPDTGNTSQNNAGSESWELVSAGIGLGSIRADLITVYADVPGEGALVTAWSAV